MLGELSPMYEPKDNNAVHTDTSTIYILKCGHVLVDYKAKRTHAIMRHRRRCTNYKNHMLEEDIIEEVPYVTQDEIRRVIRQNATTDEIAKLRMRGINV